MSEMMEDDVSSTLENATTVFLGDRFGDAMEVGEVRVLSQNSQG